MVNTKVNALKWPLFIAKAILAIYVLYKESFLPSFAMIESYNHTQSSLAIISYFSQYLIENFNLIYLLMLFGSFILVLFLKEHIYLSTILVLFFTSLFVQTIHLTKPDLQNKVAQRSAIPISSDIPAQTGEPSDKNIQDYVEYFLKQERNRIISHPNALANDFNGFDIVILNICSMANDDIAYSNLKNHKLFNQFDYRFDYFNSVSSYSTPASLRLLRANCGQETESQIYKTRRSECELLTSLEQIGFLKEVYFDHDGLYGNYLQTLHDKAGLPTTIFDNRSLKPMYSAFDGSTIYSDRDLFLKYVNNIANDISANHVTFFNILSLHDGNKLYGQSRSQPYEPRLRTLLDDIDFFIKELSKTNKNTLFIMIPEHGAAIRGDKMQIPKLREIPTDTITNVPTMFKFISNHKDKKHHLKHIEGNYSYLALAEIIKRSIENNIFSSADYKESLDKLFTDLPQTAYVSESTNAYFLNFKGEDFFKLKGETWSKYQK